MAMRPVPENTVRTHRAPRDPAEAGRRKLVVQYTEESAEELDLVTLYSDDEVVPYAGGRTLLSSLKPAYLCWKDAQ